MIPIQLSFFLILFGQFLYGSIRNYTVTDVDREVECIGNDTLDPLPPWSYCELADSIRIYFPLTLATVADLKAIWFAGSQTFDSLRFDRARILAWSIHTRYSTIDDLHSGSVTAYLDKTLLWVDFTRLYSGEQGTALVILGRDTTLSELSPQSWHVEALPHQDSSRNVTRMVPYSRLFFSRSDSMKLRSTAISFLQVMSQNDTILRWTRRKRTYQYDIAQSVVIRSNTWKRLFGTAAPDKRKRYLD